MFLPHTGTHAVGRMHVCVELVFIIQLLGNICVPHACVHKNFDSHVMHPIMHPLQDITIPLLTMATRDDPLIHPNLPNHAINASKTNPNVFSVTTNTGGHLGWLTGWSGKWWQQEVVFTFLDAFMEQMKSCAAK